MTPTRITNAIYQHITSPDMADIIPISSLIYKNTSLQTTHQLYYFQTRYIKYTYTNYNEVNLIIFKEELKMLQKMKK